MTEPQAKSGSTRTSVGAQRPSRAERSAVWRFLERERAAARRSGRAQARRMPWRPSYRAMPDVEGMEDLA